MSENYSNPVLDGDTAYASIKTMMVDGKPTDILRHYIIPEHFPVFTMEAITMVLDEEFLKFKSDPKVPANGKVGYFTELKLGAETDKAIRAYKRKQSGYVYKLGKS
jgi:hypothetical protein